MSKGRWATEFPEEMELRGTRHPATIVPEATCAAVTGHQLRMTGTEATAVVRPHKPERPVVAGSGCSSRSLGHPLARRAAPQPTIKSTLARQIDEFVAVFAVAREMIPERDMIRPQKVDIETIDVAGRR